MVILRLYDSKEYNKTMKKESKHIKRVGIDIHGVININPIFSKLCKELKEKRYEIHILTGPRLEYPYKTNIEEFERIEDELEKYDIVYDVLFSVLDYNVKKGSNVWKNERGWWTDTKSWNETKGLYCKEKDILLHIDDTKVYGDTFETPFGYLSNETMTIEFSGIDKTSDVIQDFKCLEKYFTFKF